MYIAEICRPLKNAQNPSNQVKDENAKDQQQHNWVNTVQPNTVNQFIFKFYDYRINSLFTFMMKHMRLQLFQDSTIQQSIYYSF